MILRRDALLLASICFVQFPSCGVLNLPALDLPIETSFAFTNLSQTMYAQLELRTRSDSGEITDVYRTPLLAPGAIHRRRFLDTLNNACPEQLDLRVLLYSRINKDVPIGLDMGETVEATPVAAGEILNVPTCEGSVVETYTIVNWDAPVGIARVKLAQDTPIDELIRSLGLFPNTDAVWEIQGVASDLVDAPPQPLAEIESIEGRVISPDGAGIGNIGVLLRSRFRVRLTDDDPSNDPDSGFGDPIDVVATEGDGTFRFDRPAGAYRVEVFSDDFAFRPATVDVESPVDTLLIVAESIDP